MIKVSGCIKTFTCKNLLKAKPGGPPPIEYKQSMAMYKTSPHPGPMKRKLNKGGLNLKFVSSVGISTHSTF